MNSLSVTPPNGQAARTNGVSSAKSSMDYNSFLRLFMAQMKNQDPTKPNDPSETLSQLASFSNVEQSIKLNEKLDSLLLASSATMAAGLVGKTVKSLDGATSGIVKSVEIGPEGLIATLKDGKTFNLSAGYSVSAS